MPIYIYFCNNCEEETKVKHSIKETLSVCPSCKVEEALTRKPSIFYKKGSSKKNDTNTKIGEVVDKFIEDTKKELAIEKNKLKKGF